MKRRTHALPIYWGVLLFLISLLSPNSGTGQWRRIPLPGEPIQIFSVHFLDYVGTPEVGFAYGDGIYKTNDGGWTWRRLHIGIELFVNSDMTFKDARTGWLTYLHQPFASEPGDVAKTTDGGESWFPTMSPMVVPAGIHYSKSSGVLCVAGEGNGSSSYFSTDEGSSWQRMLYIGDERVRFAFASEDSGIICSFFAVSRQPIQGYTPWEFTADGGRTWRVLAMDSNSWQPLAIPHTQTYFTLTPDGSFIRTDDNWETWNVIYTFPKRDYGVVAERWQNTSTVRGTLDSLFVQTSLGVYFSTTQGISWQWLCGPRTDWPNWMIFYIVGRTLFCSNPFTPLNPGGYGNLWRLNLDSLDIPTDISCRFAKVAQLTQPDAHSEVRLEAQVHDRATDSLHFRIRYDAEAFRWSRADLPEGWRVGVSDDGAGVVELTITKNGTPSNDSTFGLIFSTVLSKERAEIIIESQKVFSYEFAAECIASEYQRPDTLTVEFAGCVDPLLLSYMRTHKLFDILSASPNPASKQILVEVARHLEGAIEYELLDVLGHVQKQGEISGTKLTLGVSDLPSGSYILRLSLNGAVQTREVVVSR